MPPPAAAIFDMDGLLLDTERISLLAWRAGAAAVGIAMPDAVFLDMIGHRHEDCRDILIRYASSHANIANTTGETPAPQAAPAAFTAAALATISAAMSADYGRRLALGIPVMPGARELLQHLHSRHLPLAVATSTHRDLARHKLDATGLLPFFTVIIGGDCVPRGKPAPDIYLAAAAALGVSPAACIAFEDSSPGALSAATAGMRVVIVPDLKPPTEEARTVAYAVLPSLREALGLFP